MTSTIDLEEIEKFNRISGEWWDVRGKFKPLHQMNPTRISFILSESSAHFGKNIAGMSLLDVGCGGGLISEPMSRLGADVTGIDASNLNIEIAKNHASESGLEISYLNKTAEELAENEAKFDIILALEIVEHVANLEIFLEKLAFLLKPGGIIFISTINRTPKSFLGAIIAAEYILRWLPIGTHDWQKFLKPSEISEILLKNHIFPRCLSGMTYHPISSKWSLNEKDLSINYIMSAAKG